MELLIQYFDDTTIYMQNTLLKMSEGLYIGGTGLLDKRRNKALTKMYIDEIVHYNKVYNCGATIIDCFKHYCKKTYDEKILAK